MANVLVPGTIAAEPGSMTAAILSVFESLLAPDIFAAAEVGLARMSNAIAVGVCANIVASIDDAKYLQVDGGEIVGGDGGGGGAAPDTAEYLVGASVGSLSAERVVTNTATGVWDLSTPGQAKLTVPAASTGAAGVVELATSVEVTAGLAVQASDPRLSDDRDPTSHGSSHASDGSDPIPAATTSVRGIVELATDGQSDAGVVVQGNDARLFDARDPTAHKVSHQKDGSDQISVNGLAGQLAEPQAPSAHASSHMAAGADPIRIDELKVGTDITTLNASTSQHGLMPKFSGSSGEFFNGLGAQVIPQEYPKTAYEIDWSAHASVLGIADGNVAVSGVNWTAANVAGSTTFQILNGSGLQITALAGLGRTWTGSVLTSPALRVTFADIAAEAAKYHLTLTVWSYFSAWSLPFSSNAIIAGCYAPAAGAYTTGVYGTGFVHSGANALPMLQRSTTLTPVTTIGAAFDVVVWRCLPGGITDSWAGVWAAGWPTLLTPIGSDNQPTATTIVTTAQFRRAGAQLVYTPATRSASGAPSFTLARTRIQVG
jgi:hypothetical protein